MTEKQIEVFITVATTGSFVEAAKKLSISEPAVSRAIRMMENEFNCEFFIRDSRKRIKTFTEKGSIMFDIAKRWKYMIDGAKRIADVCNVPYRICAVSSVTEVLIPSLTKRLLQMHPNQRIYVDSIGTRIATTAVANNQFDIAFVSFIIPNQYVEVVPLYEEELMVVLSNDIAANMNNNTVIKLRDLDPQRQLFIPWDTDSFIWEYNEYQKNDDFTLLCNTNDGLDEYIKEMQMWALVPASSAQRVAKLHDLSAYKIADRRPVRKTFAIRNIHNNNPLFNEALNIMREKAGQIDGINIIK